MPWVFGLPLSASLHYKRMGLGGWGTQTDRQAVQEASVDLLLIGQVKV